MIRLVEMSESTEVARPLKVLIPLIKEDLAKGREAAEIAAMPYYIAAGRKLSEARGSPELKRQFGEWVDANFKISLQQARRYMALAGTTDDVQKQRGRSFKSLREMERETGRDPRPTGGYVHREWREDVDRLAERARHAEARLIEEHLTRKQEREAKRELAERLIDIGYKVLAKELHPDKGGSKDAIQRLHEVRAELKGHRFI